MNAGNERAIVVPTGTIVTIANHCSANNTPGAEEFHVILKPGTFRVEQIILNRNRNNLPMKETFNIVFLSRRQFDSHQTVLCRSISGNVYVFA